MTIQLTVNEEKGYVLLEFDAMDNWQVFHNGMHQFHTCIENLKTPVDAIIVQKALPPAGNPIPHFRSAITHQPENLRQIVVVNPRNSSFTMAFMQQLILVFAKMFLGKSKITLLGSIQEAEAFLTGRTHQV